MTALLQQLYGYQAWANADLFDKLTSLAPQPDAQLHIALRLINHTYVVSQIFLGHLTGAMHDYHSDNTDETPPLHALRKAITTSDQWYHDYLQGLSGKNLAEAIPFTFTDGDKGYMTREEMLTHVALHAGYHRGEVGRLLSQLAITPPWDTFAVYLHQLQPARRQQAGKKAALT